MIKSHQVKNWHTMAKMQTSKTVVGVVQSLQGLNRSKVCSFKLPKLFPFGLLILVFAYPPFYTLDWLLHGLETSEVCM